MTERGWPYSYLLELRHSSAVRALSLQQPWCYCITNGRKRVENRRWRATHRGPLLLHAGLHFQNGMELAIHEDSPDVDVDGMRSAPRGALIALCRISDCLAPGDDTRLRPDQRIWSDVTQFRFVLSDIVLFPEPIPWRGMLGFFDVPIDAIKVQLVEAIEISKTAAARFPAL